MCFHISNTKKNPRKLEDRFDATFEDSNLYQPYYHFNGWELKNLYIITQDDPETIQLAKWGVLPSNYDLSNRTDFLKNTNTLNATKERLFESPLYSQFIDWQRCLIVADGFFEPHNASYYKGKIPYYFKRPDHSLFAFAGIYNEVENEGKLTNTASVITTEANPFFKEIHNSPNKRGSYRMPLILDKKDEYDWLYLKNEKSDINQLLNTISSEKLVAYSVSNNVFKNNIDSNTASILDEVEYRPNTLF
mgnify:CR=1 FL=1